MRRMIVGLAVVIVLGTVLPVLAQETCPCFTAPQVDRWLVLALLSGGKLDACMAPNITPEIQVVMPQAPQSVVLTVGGGSGSEPAPICQVATDGSNALAGIASMQAPLTTGQAAACLAILRLACGG